MKIAVAGATGMVGMRLVRAAEAVGLDVRGMSRRQGVDLFSGVGVHEALEGAEVVVDVVQSPTLDEAEATHFFRRVAVILGRGAQRAGVERLVVLSVIGCDRLASSDTPEFGLDGYYRAKFAHEQATREEAPSPSVLRSAQLFNFVGQEIERGRQGEHTTRIPDLLIQPVDLDEVVTSLLAVASGTDERRDVQVAGPRRERLVGLASRFTHRHHETTKVVPLPVDQTAGSGLLLPGPGVDLVGQTFNEWLDAQPVC
jgi:uncharacterized protein YbjT (DUF2867 family)